MSDLRVFTDGEIVITTLGGEEYVESFEGMGKELELNMEDVVAGGIIDSIIIRQTDARIVEANE